MNTIYLSGPMSAYSDSDYGYALFRKMASDLRSVGFTVLDPSENFGGATDRERKEYMRLDFSHVMEATDIVVLPGWYCSPGAVKEVMMARELGLGVCKLFRLGKSVGETSFQKVPKCIAEIALEAITESMAGGLAKHGDGIWEEEPFLNHSNKAARHAITAQLIKEGLSPNDKEGVEGHLRNAICRSAMALALHSKHQPFITFIDDMVTTEIS